MLRALNEKSCHSKKILHSVSLTFSYDLAQTHARARPTPHTHCVRVIKTPNSIYSGSLLMRNRTAKSRAVCTRGVHAISQI